MMLHIISLSSVICQQYVFENVCITSCPLHSTASVKTCQCDSGYLVQVDACVTQCSVSYYELASKCVKQCPVGQFVDLQQKMCTQSCPSGNKAISINSISNQYCFCDAFINLDVTGCIYACPVQSGAVSVLTGFQCVCNPGTMIQNQICRCPVYYDGQSCQSACAKQFVYEVDGYCSDSCLLNIKNSLTTPNLCGVCEINHFHFRESNVCTIDCDYQNGTVCEQFSDRVNCPAVIGKICTKCTGFVNQDRISCVESCNIYVDQLGQSFCLESCPAPLVVIGKKCQQCQLYTSRSGTCVDHCGQSYVTSSVTVTEITYSQKICEDKGSTQCLFVEFNKCVAKCSWYSDTSHNCQQEPCPFAYQTNNGLVTCISQCEIGSGRVYNQQNQMYECKSCTYVDKLGFCQELNSTACQLVTTDNVCVDQCPESTFALTSLVCSSQLCSFAYNVVDSMIQCVDSCPDGKQMDTTLKMYRCVSCTPKDSLKVCQVLGSETCPFQVNGLCQNSNPNVGAYAGIGVGGIVVLVIFLIFIIRCAKQIHLRQDLEKKQEIQLKRQRAEIADEQRFVMSLAKRM